MLRLRIASADPREPGVGNGVNCRAVMYFAPVGLMHAGDPQAAYADAVALAGAPPSKPTANCMATPF